MAVRYPAVAGTFYPGDKPALLHLLEHLFGEIKKIEQDCLGVVSPHAGYEFSGRTAARAIASLKDAGTFVILGPNHHLGPEPKPFAVSLQDWETPLGKAPINRELAINLDLEAGEDAHMQEHSIEVQLPFLQYRFKAFDFVPISVMNQDYSKGFLGQCRKLGKAIAKEIKGKPMGVIASSDFSHYLPRKIALEKDEKAMKHILALDTPGLFKTLDRIDASVCGFGPIAVLMETARALKLKPRKIHHSTSADAIGETNAVVAYNAIGFS